MRLLVSAVLFIVLTAPAPAAWREATSDNFIVYSDGSEAELVSFTQRVEKFDQLLRMMTGLKQPATPVKVRIYLVSGGETVRELDPSHRPLVGFYSSRISGGLAIVDRDRARSEFATDGQTVLFHEYCHHFMEQYFPNAYPVWYQEGFAEYFASTAFTKDGTIEIGRIEMARVPALYNEPWLSTQQLMNDTLEQLPVKDWDHFYAQGWLLTHYLFHNSARHAQFNQYLHLRTQGAPHAESLQKAFGLTDEQLGVELRAYFSAKKLPMTRLITSGLKPSEVSTRLLSQPEADFLLLALRLELGFPKAEREKVLERVRAKAVRFRDSEYAQAVLARAEAHYGDAARGHELLQALLTSAPDDRRVLLDLAGFELAAELHDAPARLEADRRARTLTVKANRLAPNDPEALFLFYLSFAHEAEGPSQNAIDALNEAYLYLPQYQPIALALARQELRIGKPDLAISVLKPIAYSPHGGQSAQKVRTWIQDIEAKKLSALAGATVDESLDESTDTQK